jgi:hypothetical protein
MDVDRDLRPPVNSVLGLVRAAAIRRAAPGAAVVNRLSPAGQAPLMLQDEFSRRLAPLRCERSADSGELPGRRPGLGAGRRPPRRHRAPAERRLRVRIRLLATQEQKAGTNQMHIDLTSTSLVDQQQTVARSRGLVARHIDLRQARAGSCRARRPEGDEFYVISRLCYPSYQPPTSCHPQVRPRARPRLCPISGSHTGSGSHDLPKFSSQRSATDAKLAYIAGRSAAYTTKNPDHWSGSSVAATLVAGAGFEPATSGL